MSLPQILFDLFSFGIGKGAVKEKDFGDVALEEAVGLRWGWGVAVVAGGEGDFVHRDGAGFSIALAGLFAVDENADGLVASDAEDAEFVERMRTFQQIRRAAEAVAFDVQVSEAIRRGRSEIEVEAGHVIVLAGCAQGEQAGKVAALRPR